MQKRLGFGCSGLMNRLDRRTSLSLIETAFMAGLTHFDTAPLYGHGEAEGILGDFIAHRRHEITVTTKVGILPPASSTGLTIAKSVARRVARFHPGLRRAMQRRASRMVTSGAFDTASMRHSLDRSLLALKTDHIHYLLLHEARPGDLVGDEVMLFLGHAKTSGKIGAYGLGTDVETIKDAISSGNPLVQVVQFPSSVFDSNMEVVAAPPTTKVITHSSLGHRFELLRAHLAQDQALLRRWSEALHFDVRDGGQLGRLLLAAAILKNPGNGTRFLDLQRTNHTKRVTCARRSNQDAILVLNELARAWAATQPTKSR